MPKSFSRSVRWDTQAGSYQFYEQAGSTIRTSDLDFQSHVWQDWLEQISSFAFQARRGIVSRHVKKPGDVETATGLPTARSVASSPINTSADRSMSLCLGWKRSLLPWRDRRSRSRSPSPRMTNVRNHC